MKIRIDIISDSIFIKEYDDEIIVSFLNVGEESKVIADQIHQLVTTNPTTRLFSSDIIDFTTCLDDCSKYLVRDSLYVFINPEDSISGYSINTHLTDKGIDVFYNSELLFKILHTKTYSFWFLFAIVLSCVGVCLFIGSKEDIIPDDNHTVISSADTVDSVKAADIESEDLLVSNQVDKKPKTASILADDFILVPGGTLKEFYIGVDENYNAVYRDYTLDAFYICKHEVTQKEYTLLMDNNPSFIIGSDLPVNAVQYIEAIQYCNKRSESEGYDGFYVINDDAISIKPYSNGYRLPNKHEWVYAARKDEASKTKYASGNSISRIAWYGGNSNNTLHPVCTTRESNGRGIFDMNGNVVEWLWEMPFDKSNCFMGGGFLSYIGFCESDLYATDHCSEENGFRVVLITKEQNNNNIGTLTTVPCYTLEYYHAVDDVVKHQKQEAEISRKKAAAKTEAQECIRIADKAYSDFIDSFDESQIVLALTHYRKALELDKNHLVLSLEETERIENSIKALEREL